MEEINLKELFIFYIKRIYIILILAVLGFVVGKKKIFTPTPMYSSTSKIYISSLAKEDEFSDVQLFQNYRNVAINEDLIKKGIELSEVKVKYDDFIKDFSLTADPDNGNLYIVTVNGKKKTDVTKLNKSISELIVGTMKKNYKILSIKIAQEASKPTEPYNSVPASKKHIMYAGAGFCAGVVIIFIMFYFNTTIKSKESLEEYNLLGDMPNKNNRLFRDKLSLIESKLLLGDNAKTVLVTSIDKKNEINLLTKTLSQLSSLNNKVLYINANIRNTDNTKGYSDLIKEYNGKNKLDNYITKEYNLDVMSSGTLVDDAISLLSNKNNEKVIDELKKKYDYIFIETSELKNKSDALILSKLVDKTVVIVKQNKTKIEELKEAEKAFNQINSKIDGIVFDTTK